MYTSFVFRFLLLVAVIVLSVSSSFSPTSTNDATILANFTAIGTVEGKTYFVDQTFTGTWHACKTFCKAAGMHLASITSEQQWNFLDGAPFNYSGPYWTGGRDSQTTSQFSWDFNNQTLNNNYTSLYDYGQIMTCVYYYAPTRIDRYLRSWQCNAVLNPLCEFIHGK